jgi:hypothetical protein
MRLLVRRRLAGCTIGRIGAEESFGMGVIMVMIMIAMGVIVAPRVIMILFGGGGAGRSVLVRRIMAALTSRENKAADHQGDDIHGIFHGSPPIYCSSM